MTERMEKFDEDPDLEISSRLSDDLQNLFKPEFSVQPEVDRAILDKANKHFTGRQFLKNRPRFRWIKLWKVAAAAAVVIFAFSLDLHRKPQRIDYNSAMTRLNSSDFDRDGQVNILDAFKLARQIELAGGNNANFDINGDGLINSDDVDKIAFAAVSLSPENQGAGKGIL